MVAVVLPGFLMSSQMNKEDNVCSRQNKTDSRRYKNNSSKNLFHYIARLSFVGLFIAITRYSNSAPFGWLTKVDSVSIAVATSCH